MGNPRDSDDSATQGGPVRRVLDATDETPLSRAVLDAVAAHEQGDIDPENFILYNTIDPEALDQMFDDKQESQALVEFDFDHVRVKLWRSEEAVTIYVTGREQRQTKPDWAE